MNDCIIHCTTGNASDDLASLQDAQSWQTLLRAATIREYEPVTELGDDYTGNEFPEWIKYHRRCRSTFTLKRDLDKIVKEKNRSDKPVIITPIRRSIRGEPTTSTTYERVCNFCDQTRKYIKGKDTREHHVLQRIDLRSDKTIRETANAKNDTKMLALVSRDIVAAEACYLYHRSCYRDYTRPAKSTSTSSKSSLDDEHAQVDSSAYEMLFDYIRTDILDNPRVVKLSDLSAKLMNLMNEKGVSAIKDSTKTHVRRKLETEFGGLLHFEDLLGNNRVFIIPDNLSRNHLAGDLISLQLTQCKEKGSRTEEIRRVALELRKAIQSTGSEEMSWPPKASELNEDAIRTPEDVKHFLVTLLTGSSSYKPNDPCQEKDQRLVNSFGQDWIFAVTNGRQKPPKQHPSSLCCQDVDEQRGCNALPKSLRPWNCLFSDRGNEHCPVPAENGINARERRPPSR